MEGRVRFSASAALVKRLGSELIRDPQTAFFELIKNSYDADATEVRVTFRRRKSGSGTITITDNGSGMTLEDLKTKWARAAGENKVREPYTPELNRRRLGEKGIGRFSLAKLGRCVKVITRPSGVREQLVFALDFAEFTDVKDFDKMEIAYEQGAPRSGFANGTILEISDLCDTWGKREIKKVRGQLCHLIDPDRKDQDFKIFFTCPEFPDLEGLLENPISGLESHRIGFSIDSQGSCRRTTAVGGDETTKSETREPLSCGPVEGVIRYYREGVKKRDRSLTDRGEESHMGVKVYRDGCRVRPYGEDADDWLEVEKRRARGHGKYYVHPKAIAGSVYISSTQNPGLADATNREAGIIETEQFQDFRAFVREHVDLLNQILEQETRSESQREKRQTVEKILSTVVSCLNRQQSDTYGKYVDRLDRSKKGQYGQSSKQKTALVTDVKLPTKEEWRCLDCDERWRVLKRHTPARCMEFAVNRRGEPRKAEGCGSENIERSRHHTGGDATPLSSIVSGEYALVGGKQLRVRVDPEMGRNEDEFDIDEREIIINGNHPAYTVAEKLDGISGRKYELGDDTFNPALTIHITKCVSMAWAELHYRETERWVDFKSQYDSLQASICESVLRELQARVRAA